MTAYFNRFSISMTLAQAQSCSHSGQCDSDVAALRKNKSIIRQTNKLKVDDVAAELKETGAWTSDELSIHDDNLNRIIWISAAQIVDENRARCSKNNSVVV